MSVSAESVLRELMERVDGCRVAALSDCEGVAIAQVFGDDVDQELMAGKLAKWAAACGQMTEQATRIEGGSGRGVVSFGEDNAVVQIVMQRLVVTMVTDVDANVGFILDMGPSVAAAFDGVSQKVSAIMGVDGDCD